MKRGRRGAADNIVPLMPDDTRLALTPCHPLTKSQQQLFTLVVNEKRHLRPLDTPLLTGYVIACAGMFTEKDPATFAKLAAVAVSIGTRLRLTPQSRTHPTTLARRINNADMHQGLYQRRPWDRNDPGDDDVENDK